MGLLVSILLSDILPIFAIAGAGFLLARYAGVDVRMLARAVFYSLLPCLAFRLLVTSSASGPDVVRLMLLAVLIMGGMGLVGFVVAKRLGLDGKSLRAFMMVVMFSNGGNYGLPVVGFAFGAEALTYATIFFLTGSVMTYVAGPSLPAAIARRSRALSKRFGRCRRCTESRWLCWCLPWASRCRKRSCGRSIC